MDGDLYYNPSIGKLHVPLTLQMPHSATIKLGDSQDLKLYHDGDDSYIKELLDESGFEVVSVSKSDFAYPLTSTFFRKLFVKKD